MKKMEICLHCGDDYIPKKRGVQKFCSNSCRSRYWYVKQKKVDKNIDVRTLTVASEKSNVPSPEKLSWAGIGNAAVGTGAVKVVTDLLTPEERKPATKKELNELKEIVLGQRYFPVNNGLPDAYGRNPFYDIETGNMVYL